MTPPRLRRRAAAGAGVAGLALLAGAWGVVRFARLAGDTGHPALPGAGKTVAAPLLAPSAPSAVSASPMLSVSPVAASTKRLDRVRMAYAAGSYWEAIAGARAMIGAVAAEAHPALTQRREAVRARHLLAFAAARQRDLPTARAQFALLRTEAAALPRGGKGAAIGAAPAPSLEEEAAYQHAVCTAALGEKAAAEKEYVAFMARYPESPLVPGAIKRIARLYGGDIPPSAEAVWTGAMRTARSRETARQRAASVCGPECLGELIRRRTGASASVPALATVAGTSERGTSLGALARTARRHGWPHARGVALTHRGLLAQKLPVIALVSAGPGGHFVLVDRASKETVTVWDPDAHGVGQGASRACPVSDWQKQWRGGITLVLD